MTSSIERADLQQMTEDTLARFQKRVADLPPDLQGPFNAEAKALEAEILTIYRVVAMLARKEQDLDKVAELWGLMKSFCDLALSQLSELHRSHPFAGAEVYHDRILDVRNRCQRLQTMHA